MKITQHRKLSEPRSFYRPYCEAIDGYSDSPARGDAARGQAYLTAIVDALAAAMVEFDASVSG